MIAWLSVLAALAAADPAEDDAKLACDKNPPPHHRRALGRGSGTEKKALREAHEAARQTLLQETTVGFSDVRRDALAAHIVSGESDYSRRQACAAADVDRRWIDAFAAEADQYEADIASLAESIAQRVGEGGLLQLDAPTWAHSSCVAAIGPTLTTALRNALASHAVQLVRRGSSNPAATRLRLELAAEAQGVRLSAALYRRDQGTEAPLPGFQFPLDLFNTTVAEAGACVSDAALGLQQGQRAGAVQIALDLPTQDGFICESEQLAPALRSSTPVYAQVFSIYGDQTLAVWSGRVDGTVSLGSFQAVRLNEEDEKLLVVAAPSQQALGALAGLPAFCRLDGGLKPALYPDGAAIDSATYTIWPAGTHGCADVDTLEEARQRASEALAGVPACR